MSPFNYYPNLRPLLFKLDAEKAHHLTLNFIKTVDKFLPAPQPGPAKHSLFGRPVRNLVGLAAGLDKNGEYLDPLGRLGFGFMEVGTVTPKPQPGNPQPRLFRIPQAECIINRMGFNNQGLDSFLSNIKKSQWQKNGGCLGLNIGKNASTPTENAVSDYLLGLQAVYNHADYVTINISSPNTKNLRDLQQHEQLNTLLEALSRQAEELGQTYSKKVPLMLKIAPDLNQEQIMSIAELVEKYQFGGVIATNTTLSREAVKNYPNADEAGGLSGPPVHQMSLSVISELRRQLSSDFTIIGVGGINSPQRAIEKIQAGADAVQIYTGLIYQGPNLVKQCIAALDK